MRATLTAAATSCLLLPFAASAAVDFSKDVFPVLQRACFECHGPEQEKGGLRLHLQETLTRGGKSGPVIVAGQPDHSELLRRVSLPRTDKDAMPKRGTPLTPTEIRVLREWIASGAAWPASVEAAKHWSYKVPVRPVLPRVQDTKWVANPIDRFVLARLEKAGLKPSAEADPAVLYRRLSLDLTGLPPAVADVDAFVAAYPRDPKALEAAVDHLLASKEFGVRWARPWLDLARYADSHGFQRDDLRDIWAYRDWVVDALNSGMPFDQFTVEQVAGDLLPNATAAQKVATGFHRCTPTNVEAGTEPEESRINQVIDRVNTTGAVWLGSTLECAQCHNHKYDPFTQRDYYSMLAYYNNTEKEAERSNPKTPGSIRFLGAPMDLPDAVQEKRRAELTDLLAVLDQKLVERRTFVEKAEKVPAASVQAGPAPVSAAASVVVLKPVAFDSESGAESEVQPDMSLLLSGTVPDVDEYSVELELPAGSMTGLQIEALSDPSLPGTGPGRGNGERPNFVLQEFHAGLLRSATKDATPEPLKFAEAHASFSQNRFNVDNLLTNAPKAGWAIMPRFGKSHWAVFALAKPVQIEVGTRLKLKLVQNYGGGRVIGRLRVSLLRGDVLASLPKTEPDAKEDAEPQKPAKPADPQLTALQRERTKLQREFDALKPSTTEVMKELSAPRMSAIFKRGVYTDPADPVTAGAPSIFDAKASGPPNRLTLAKWLVSRDNPLAARVAVNRWWAELFGQGIVTTVEDFGIKGAPPSHPELLDWLAVEFMEQRWSMKQMLKTIVMSSTYRQTSAMTGAGTEADPENHLLWHVPRHRLDAEAIRDNALAISGLLDLKQGGPPIRPPQPDGLWAKVGGQQYKYVVSPGSEQHRRGLYVVLKRGAPYPSFVNFDSSARMACVVKRSRSNTPLQALTLLNDPVYVEATKAFAVRIMEESPSSDVPARITHAVRLALARQPRPQELAVLTALYEEQQKSSSSEDAAWYAVASALLNLDECITKG